MAFSPELVQELVTQGNVIERGECIEGLPEGAVYIDASWDSWRRVLYMVFTHDSFEDVPPGEVLPVLDIVIRRFYE